ncbi:MAG: outer membrane beta-barrel protein [Verrucomicrobiota bacterium]|nr:outer membrane beta-barrel protein [Verrucomicrobiota bacterium]
MKNNFPFLLSFLTVSLFYWISASSSVAAPFVSIGDNTDIYFNGSSSLRWASNIFRNEEDEESDLSWTISPGLEINIGRGTTNADITVITRYDIVRYDEYDRLDTELFHIEALGTYESSRLNLNGSASFDEIKMNDGTNNVTNDLVELDKTSGDLDAEYRVSPKFSFSAGVRYDETEYQTFKNLFSDRATTAYPLSVYYDLTPKLDLILGYTYSVTDVEGGNSYGAGLDPIVSYEQDTDFFNIGLRGNISTKLTGFFKIGYRTVSAGGKAINESNESIDRSDRDMLGLNASLTWMATSKLLYQLALSRDYKTGGLGEATEVNRANLVGNYSFNTHWSAMANLGYTDTDSYYLSRENEQFTGGLRVMYVLNAYWRFTAGYTYAENDSNRVNSSYKNESLDLTATLRY